MNLGMYVITTLFHGYFACTIFVHSLCKTNERAQRVSLFCLVFFFAFSLSCPSMNSSVDESARF